MRIANPIYDVVFKYLMEDNKVAQTLVSEIIGEEIETLELRPQEYTIKIPRDSEIIAPITVYRLDFNAKIKTPQGLKAVLIEIQKAKFATDIMRFRKYLGEQYQSDINIYEPADDPEQKKAIPLVSIYFLGHKLDHAKEPIIKVKRHYYDGITGAEIHEQEDFIESLTHDSFVIQIPYLRKQYRNELEILLSVFNQSNRSEDHHILNVKEEDFPEKYRPLIRRLQKAIAEPQMLKDMDVEDEVLGDLGRRERAIAKRDKIIARQNQELEEKNRIIQELQRKLDQ